MTGLVFDAGGLLALERNDRRVLTVIRTVLVDNSRIVIPATTLAQVIRNPARQVRLWRLIRDRRTDIVPLDTSYAQAVGVLLGGTGTADIVDAHVVICAQRSGFDIITSDPFDLRRLDPHLRLITV